MSKLDEIIATDPTVLERDLLRNVDAQALALLDGLNKTRRLDQDIVGNRVEPGAPAPERFDLQIATLEIASVDAASLDLRGMPKLRRESMRVLVLLPSLLLEAL